jgi:ribosome silencing factor RsfS/YbeB/iojap
VRGPGARRRALPGCRRPPWLLGEADAKREEAAIARTPKAPEDAPKPRRAAAKAPTKAKPAPRTAAPARAAGKAPAKPAARPAAQAPAKAPARSAAKAPAKAPTRTASKDPAKATARTASKAPAKAPARTASKAPTRTAAKAPAKATAKPAAKATRAPTRAAPAKPTTAKSAAKAPAAPRPVRAAKSRQPKIQPALLDRLVEAARKSLEDDKAENLVVLDVTGRADYADRLVIATGLADRQIQAMATHLEDAFEKEGLKLRRDAIQGSPDWVLIDAGDLVVHLFKPEARGLYALERMWGPDSPAANAPEDRTPLPDDGSGGSTAAEEDDE